MSAKRTLAGMATDERTIWLDGELRPMSAASTPLLAQSLQRGTLVFDIYGVFDRGGPHGLGAREHTERFVGSCELMGMPMPYDVDTLLGVAGELVRANPGTDTVRLNAWWSTESLDLLPTADAPSVAVTAVALGEVHPGMSHGPAPQPARLTLPGLRKMPPDVLPVQAKVAASYAHATVAKARARAAGFHDALLLGEEGRITESGSMSFFLVVDEVLRAPDLDEVLDGITRRVVIDAARHEGIPVVLGPTPRALLDEAQEAFLASTTRDVWPVVCIDDREFDAPGPVTALLLERVLQIVGGNDPLSARWLQAL
jgi:branched-chain amino acid aminotransferase